MLEEPAELVELEVDGALDELAGELETDELLDEVHELQSQPGVGRGVGIAWALT